MELFRLISGPHFDAVGGAGACSRSRSPAATTLDGSARQTMAIIASPDRTWDLRRVQAPTLVVHGLLDRLVMPSGWHRHRPGDPRARAS